MNNSKITMLKGADRIRKRPAVIFSSDGVEGAQEAVQNLLHIFAREALLGFCKHLSVKQAGELLEISGDDRGIYLGQDTGDDTVWQSIFSSALPLPRYSPDDSGCSLALLDDNHASLYGEKLPPDATVSQSEPCYLELYALQCVCARMDVRVNRNGIQSKLHFECGNNIGGIRNQQTEEPNGSCFQFTLDREVFSETLIPESYFLKMLEIFAFHAPGLKCTYENPLGKTASFCYPNGISDYVQSGASSIPVFRGQLEAKGRNRYNRAEYKAYVDIAIGYTPEAGGLRCYHNFRELTYGGTHAAELQKQLCQALNHCYCPYIPGEETANRPQDLTFDEISRHITCVIISRCPSGCSMWKNGTRLSIENPMITDMTHDIMVPEFQTYIYHHKEEYRELIRRILAVR